MKNKRTKKPTKNTRFAVALTVFSTIGLISAFWQIGQKIHALNNPGAPLSCNLSPVMDCGKILEHPLSAVFGVPNAMLGMIFFAVMMTIGILLLLGVQANKGMKMLLSGFALGTLAFTGWFFAVSLYEIGKICVFCIAIWTAIVPLFYLTVKEYAQDYTFLPKPLKPLADSIASYPFHFIFTTYAIMIGLFLVRFQDYYFG